MSKVIFDDTKEFQVNLLLEKFDKSVRLKRALQGFGLFFGLALVSVFIPVLHFFLVPVFLILSFVMGYRKYRQRFAIDLINFNCPKCSNSISEKKIFAAESSDLKVYCYNCRENMRFELN